MRSAYFDTSVYSQIDDGTISPQEHEALRDSLRAARCTVRLSVTNLEELLGEWGKDRNAAVRKLRLVRDLVGFVGMLQPPEVLLADAVQAYADGVSQPSPTIQEAERRPIARALAETASGSARFVQDVSKIVADVRAQKEAFKFFMTGAKEGASATLKARGIPDESSFADYWNRAATDWAATFADRVNLGTECRERGLDGLLDLRLMRLTVLAWMSLIFSQVTFGRTPKIGDGYDVYHAMLASTSDVFFTCDSRFAESISRVPTDGFRVVTSVSDFLAAC